MLSRRGFLDTVCGVDRRHMQAPDYIIAIMVAPIVLAKGKPWPVKVGALLVYLPWVVLWMLPGVLTIFFAIGRDMWREMK